MEETERHKKVQEAHKELKNKEEEIKMLHVKIEKEKQAFAEKRREEKETNLKRQLEESNRYEN